MKILRLLSLFCLCSCSRLLWREATLGEILVFDSPSLRMEVSYEERDSWNPLQGTSDKRDYKTVFQFQDKKLERMAWVLKTDLAVSGSQLVWMEGISTEYGVGEKNLFAFDGNAVSLRGSGFQFAISETGTLALWGKGEVVAKDQKKLVGEYFGPPLSLLVWVGKDLYLRDQDRVYVSNPRGGFSAANQFPKCFSSQPLLQTEWVRDVSQIQSCP